MERNVVNWARRWLLCVRSKYLRDMLWQMVGPEGQVFSQSNTAVRILLGGDVCFDRKFRGVKYIGVDRLPESPVRQGVGPRLRRKVRNVLCKAFLEPNLISTAHMDAAFPEFNLRSEGMELSTSVEPYFQGSRRIQLEEEQEKEKHGVPFKRISSLANSRDLVFVNLETPLTSEKRAQGMFKSDPDYAQAMRDAGISVVSLANNHIFDAGDAGLLDTMHNLKKSGIAFCGTGMSLEEARCGLSIEVKGLTVTFLGYTQWCNSRFASVAGSYPGTLPLDTGLMSEDIRRAKRRADLVIVSLHWGLENQHNVQPEQVRLARWLIDCGADAIVGHHPHIPHAIEVYRDRPIFYSLGNFIFGHYRAEWGDNYLAEIVIEDKRIVGVLIHPISGVGNELFQPEPLSGDRAGDLLRRIQLKSAGFCTGIAVDNHIGFLKIRDSRSKTRTI